MSLILRFVLVFVIFSVTVIPPAKAAKLYGLDVPGRVNPAENRYTRLVTLDTVTGAVTPVRDVIGPLSVGGIDFDSNGVLYWFGIVRHSPSNSGPEVALYTIDMRTGEATWIASPFPGETVHHQTAESFAIIGQKGYTVRHDIRDQEGSVAQLYEIDLERGTASRIGSGYRIGQGPNPYSGIEEKTLGLATDGAGLYSLRADGRIDRLDPGTGQVVATIVSAAQWSAAGGGRDAGLAFADDALWVADTTAPAGKLYRIDPDTGVRSVALDNIPNDSLHIVLALTSTERFAFSSLSGASLFANATRLGVTPTGDVYAKRPFASGAAPIQLSHARAIKSLRCVVGDGQRNGHVTAAVKRTLITALATNEPSETVVSVSSREMHEVAHPVYLRGTPAAAAARVDNRRYGYSLHVEFVSAQSFVALNPVMTPSLFFRGCVIETE